MSNITRNLTGEEQKARAEYPRPQFVREEWMNLNGEWEFEFDYGKSGIDRKLFEGGAFSRKIQVPFCPESSLSGIGCKDFMNMVWYRRKVSLTPEAGKRVLLHFQGVDYHAIVWINGRKAGEHKGGYTPFTIDITAYLTTGDNTITLCAEDEVRSAEQARGKQCEQYYSSGCDYTRTTGIWQTVWLEFVPESYLDKFKFYPNASAGLLNLQCSLKGAAEGLIIKAEAYFNGKFMGETESLVLSNEAELSLSLMEKYLWMPGEAL